MARWVALASEQQANLGVEFSPAWSECHPRVANSGGHAGQDYGAHGPVGKCGWVAVLVGEEQPAAGRAGIICGGLHKSSLQYLKEQKMLNSKGEHPLNSQKCGSEFLGVSLAGVGGDPLQGRLATFYFRTRRIPPPYGPDSSPTAR